MSFDWPLILTYHHLHETDNSRYVVSVSRFEQQLASMLEDGFTPLTLEDALATGPFGDRAAEPKTFTLTFDDALASFGDLAYPVIERLGLARFTTMFVPTKYVGADNAWRSTPTLLQRLMPWGEVAEQIMSWERIAELADAGVSMQSHGHGHLLLQRLTYDEVLADANTSLTLLSQHGIDARYFALPFGWHSEEAKRAIRDAGFDAALSVKWGGHDRYEVRRVPIYGTDSTITHKLKLSGRYFDVFDAAAFLAGKKKYRR
jgi:peptidoglycan/xylan/chitin deacetylase (PgdA/CDA1 family)